MRRLGVVLGALALLLPVLPAAPASADLNRPSGSPASTSETQVQTTSPTSDPETSCKMYATSAGFGMLCSTNRRGQTLAERLLLVGIDPGEPFCWDEELPPGFRPPRPGNWTLETCLTFEGGVVSGQTATLTYTPEDRGTEQWVVLEEPQESVIRSITGLGRIPFLLAQTSPVSSPRVGSEVSFSLLCNADVQCGGGTVRTPDLEVRGVRMWAELVHTQVLPEGPGAPQHVTDCRGRGRVMTAEELDSTPSSDPTVCRHVYERSSNERGGGDRRDRFPAEVTAYWQVWFDKGDGAQRFGLPYAKRSTNSLRVTEVQTLVVG